jgi:hypothetical protein
MVVRGSGRSVLEGNYIHGGSAPLGGTLLIDGNGVAFARSNTVQHDAGATGYASVKCDSGGMLVNGSSTAASAGNDILDPTGTDGKCIRAERGGGTAFMIAATNVATRTGGKGNEALDTFSFIG